MANKAVIFDFDGTLVETVTDICDCVNIAMQEYGYKTLSLEEVTARIGDGARNLIKSCIGVPVTDQKLDEVLAFYNYTYGKNCCNKTLPYKDIPELLTELKNRGYKLAIVTNKPQKNTDQIVENLFPNVFDKVIGQSERVKCKPDPTATLELLKELFVTPENAYFIGDGDTDVVTAKNVGAIGIAVLWGYRSKSQLEKVGATVFASTVLELLSLIK